MSDTALEIDTQETRPMVTKAPPATQDSLFRAVELQGQGKIEEAEALFRAFLVDYPDNGIALYSLSVILLKQDKLPEAMTLLKHATTAASDFAPIWFAYATAQQSIGLREEALLSYDRALALKPDYIEVLVNSGALLRDMHRHGPALERFNKVLTINPNYETALGNCAILLTEFKRSEDAIAMFERLLTINPKYDYGLGMLCYERLHACDWTNFDVTAQRIIEGVKAGQRVCKSLGFMALSDDAADHQKCAQAFADQRFPSVYTPLWKGERYRHRKIRLAYISPDFREHPVGHLMAGIFERHDKNRFETTAISLGIDDQSRLRTRMLNAFDHFVDARTMGTRQIAELMREMEIDVAVDLAGFTSDSRSDIFTHRPAPVHVNYLGYPGTLGMKDVDYIIADRFVIPPEQQQYYNEKVVYLPDTYLPTDGGLRISERTPTRAECGLPEDAVVFCSFNHDYKISPHVFTVWMNLLRQVPGSVLWLMSRNEVSQRNLRAAARAHGIDDSRLVFAGRVPLVEDHLARYRQADMFLDTHPYNAHTTAADALMAGLPVVTYMGNAFPARVAGSLLNAVGLPELVTHSLQDYEAMALKLATQPELLRSIKAKLAANHANTALFDTDRFCQHLEAIYTAMWRDAELGDAHDALSAQAVNAPALESPLTPNPSDAQLIEASIDRGNLQKAEFLCRNVLDQSPDNTFALTQLGRVASQIGAYDMAMTYYTSALNTHPDNHELCELLSQADHARRTLHADTRDHHADTPTKYLLIKAWGFGFWSDLDHVLGQLLLADITGRTPIVHWGNNSLFRDDGTVNAFESFFEPVSDKGIEDLSQERFSYFPNKWNAQNLRDEDLDRWSGAGSRLSGLYFLNRDEDVAVSDYHTKVNDLMPWIPADSEYHSLSRHAVYRRLVEKYIRLQPRLQALVDQQWQANFSGKSWLAVHVRGSDKVHEMKHLDLINQSYFAHIDKILQVNPSLSIFLLTDSTSVIDQFKARYPDRILTLDCQRSDTSTGVHYAGHAGTELGDQVILDAWLAARCHFFLGNGGSNVSVGIRHLKAWQDGTYFLIGEDFLGQRNLMLHDW
jgi:protein O-GlcNAc transferase